MSERTYKRIDGCRSRDLNSVPLLTEHQTDDSGKISFGFDPRSFWPSQMRRNLAPLVLPRPFRPGEVTSAIGSEANLARQEPFSIGRWDAKWPRPN